MAVDLQLITKLRQQTGAGLGDCKKALEENDGDLKLALDYLRKKGAKKAVDRADRETSEGVVGTYVHSNKKMAAMVALGCETDFVAKNEDFQKFVADLAMHVAAANPKYIKPEDIPQEEVEKMKQEFAEQLKTEGKPEVMIEKIVEGKLNKWYEEVCLIKQPFIKDEDVKIEDLINEKIAAISEKIVVLEFSRIEI